MGREKDFHRDSFVFLISEEKHFVAKMSEADAKDAFIIFDEAYEGNDVDTFYLGDILRALGCNVTNAKVLEVGGTAALGEKRISFEDFKPVLAAVKADLSSTGCKEDYIEGLKVFDKEGNGKVPLAEVLNSLCSLGEKLEAKESEKFVQLNVKHLHQILNITYACYMSNFHVCSSCIR